MENILAMTVAEALEKSRTNALADEIQRYKERVDTQDQGESQYRSWLNSPRHFLSAAQEAGLGRLHVVFEMPTPVDGYIDILLAGRSLHPGPGEEGRLLVVELKQWSSVRLAGDGMHVFVPGVDGGQTHPWDQADNYRFQLANHHAGIRKSGHIALDAIAYLHNLGDKDPLITEPFEDYPRYAIFGREDRQALVDYLKNSFSPEGAPALLETVGDNGFVQSEYGHKITAQILSGQEAVDLLRDQKEVTGEIKRHLQRQREDRHPEIITVCGGPGTGKTIVGAALVHEVRSGTDAGRPQRATFCYYSSKMVKELINNAFGDSIIPYLDRIGRDQDLVVVDEAHRISKLDETLDDVFDKGTAILVLMVDEHQLIRPGEEGTLAGIERYAHEHGIQYTHLPKLKIQKRCELLGGLTDAVEKMLYGSGTYMGEPIGSVRVFDSLHEMDRWTEAWARRSKAKLIAPYCWEGGRSGGVKINEGGKTLDKKWNPYKEALYEWYLRRSAKEVGCIYSCQGMDFDNVGLIWGPDLRWDGSRWVADPSESEDDPIKEAVDSGMPRDELDKLIINTYYVMLTRARERMGIWFEDEKTKEYVTQFLGLEAYDPDDADFNAPAGELPDGSWMTGKITKLAPEGSPDTAIIEGDDGGGDYRGKFVFSGIAHPENVFRENAAVSFTIKYINGKGYANGLRPLLSLRYDKSRKRR